MNHHLLSDIIFQSKQIHHQRRFSQKSSSDMYHNNSHFDKTKNLCLLGSLQFKKKQLPSQTPFMNKFQIVQLKKNKQRHGKQKDLFPNHFQSQLKTRQIHSYRNSFKIKKLQHSQIGMLQSGFAIKFSQNSKPLIDRQPISQTKKRTSQDNFQDSKVNFTHRNFSLNIETLPSKFIPGQVFNSQKSQQAFSIKQRKGSNSERQFEKKNLFLDFHSIPFNLNETKQFQSPKKFKSAAEIQDLLRQNHLELRSQNTRQNNQQMDEITFNKQQKDHKVSIKLNESPRKNRLKKIFNLQKQFQQRLQLEKKIYLEIRKQVNKNYGKPFNPPQNISAQSFIVYEITKKNSKYRKLNENINEKRKFINGHKVLVEFNSRTPCQIASLTKIMTFLVALQISHKYSIDPSLQFIRIQNFQQKISGTSANLQIGEVYTLEQLFYGLMLPSGNDASLAISAWGGQIIVKNQQKGQHFIEENILKKKRICYERFIQQMNKKAGDLGMQKTHFANSHGLMNQQNKSCSFDMALLCEQAMKNSKFRQVVKTRRYQCTIETQKQNLSTIGSPPFSRSQQSGNQTSQNLEQMEDSFGNQLQQQQPQEQACTYIKKKFKEECNISELQKILKNNNQKDFSKKVIWQNTHYLLHEKPQLYKGIKTGITSTAGPCLASFIQHNQRQFIIIVLNCKTMKQRFRDTQNLRKWAFEKEQIKLQQY